jgi:hypothetical protein
MPVLDVEIGKQDDQHRFQAALRERTDVTMKDGVESGECRH